MHSLICLAGCKQKEKLQIDAGNNFHNAFNSFDCEELQVANDPYTSKEFTELSEAYQKHTTYSGAPEDAFTLMGCDLQFTNMKYEIVYSNEICTIVRSMGEMYWGEEGDYIEEDNIVVKHKKGWVIDLLKQTLDIVVKQLEEEHSTHEFRSARP